MIRIAEFQAKALRDLDHGREFSTTKVIVPPGSEYDNPTLGEFVRYRLRQQCVR